MLYMTQARIELKIKYRVFTDSINLCDAGENISNIKKPTISLLLNISTDRNPN